MIPSVLSGITYEKITEGTILMNLTRARNIQSIKLKISFVTVSVISMHVHVFSLLQMLVNERPQLINTVQNNVAMYMYKQ